MKVVATQPGQYNQVLRMCDEQWQEVFELLKLPDGTDPKMEIWIPKKDPVTGKASDEDGEYQVVLSKDGKTPVHADFAEDNGNQMIRRGPMRGEVIRSGWMRRVPEHVACGFYPKGTDFWTKGLQIPQAYPRVYGPQDPRATPMRTHADPLANTG